MKPDTSGARIVICEDERIVALDIKAFLQRNGYEVLGIYSTAEELLADAESLHPDLVLMDIHLQGKMDGIEAADTLLKRWLIPVILLTAYADGPTIERANLTHPFAYILKPYDERELKTAISIGLYRASMERRLRRSEERYRGLFEEGLASTMLVDTEGSIVESNKAFGRFSGGASKIQDFLYDVADAKALLSAMAVGGEFTPREVRILSANNQESWALLSAAPIELSDGTSAYQCQAVDLTESKTLMEQLIHAQKLSALGRFAGGVAHDFNNVLTAIMGYSRLLRSDFETEGRSLEELDGIEQAAKRAAAISRQLLMFSRRDELRPKLFKLSDLVIDNARMLKRIVGDDVNIVTRTFEGDDSVLADRTRVEQALVNLVSNAKDAMPDGGRIIVLTGVMHVSSEMPGVIESVPAGVWSFLEVIDQGTGIDQAAQAKIFDPFFTTKPPDKGTGLGLSTVVGIVRQARGRMTMSTGPDEGTTMRLLFPLAQAPVEDAAHDSVLGSGSSVFSSKDPFRSGNKRRVLLIEKDDSVRAIVEVLLDRSGFKVTSASQPGEALLLVENESCTPDILVGDYSMRLLSGLELTERLRATFKELPALLLRGQEETSIDESSPMTLPGKVGYLDKPFFGEDLIAAIHALLD